MSKLSKGIKEEIVDAIIRDIPTIDYRAQLEAVARADSLEKLPEALKLAIKNDSSVLAHVNTDSIRCPYWAQVFGRDYKPEGQVYEKLKELANMDDAQRDKIRQLRRNLTAMFETVMTEKAFRERFPEFVQYFPEAIKTSNLPVTQVMTELMQVGWPKSKDEQNT